MNFQELGLTLRRERERKGLSIEAVMEATKISRTNIVAIENGDRSSLPHPVYAKGFIKGYSRYLGLDAAELSMVVDHEFQDEADGPEEHIYTVSPAAEKAFHENDAPEVKRKSSWALLFVLAFLVVVAVLLFMNLNNKNTDESTQPTVSTQPTEEAAPVVPETAGQTEATVAGPETQEDAGTETEGTPLEQGSEPEEPVAEPVKPESEPAKPIKKVEKAVDTDEAIGSQAEKQKYDHVLIIRATTEKGCWIGLWRGDETDMARDFVLKEGEPLRLMFNSPRRIRIGNVSGVTVTYNGNAYPLDTARGNIQTLSFGTE